MMKGQGHIAARYLTEFKAICSIVTKLGTMVATRK